MGMVKEFREFAIRGNVVDMAVGVILATFLLVVDLLEFTLQVHCKVGIIILPVAADRLAKIKSPRGQAFRRCSRRVRSSGTRSSACRGFVELAANSPHHIDVSRRDRPGATIEKRSFG